MTSWQDIQKEIDSGKTPEKPNGDFDGVRRAKYVLVSNLTQRPLLIYATAFHVPHKAQIAGPLLSIDLSDKNGFAEIIRNVNGPAVDVFLHSPGGSAEATESIVRMLRSKFETVRFIVTGEAKSAATMLALSGNSILMNQSAELGPIDPQVRVRNRFSAAGSVIEQFKKAADDLRKDPSRLPVWIPILQEFAPALQIECKNYINLSKKLVRTWLADFMFKGDRAARKKAQKIARYLSNEKNSLSHARRIDAEQLLKLGAKIEILEQQDPQLQDAVRQLHLAVMATLDSTGAVKIFENSAGAVLIRSVNIAVTPAP
ncbi:MAG: hypothetical protein D4R93_03410 [Deltaproteobacteria bacterium]|nr:MAG: hypothetical protein D4R93_03410 [Deltaproteobacteria bacterium]